MLERLIIFLKSNDPVHPAWAVVDASNRVRQVSLHDNPEGLAEIAEDKEVIIVVPAEDVLLTMAILPRMSRAKLMQALPYSLEEQLVDDVEDLHFAPGDYLTENTLPVAIVALEKMRNWMTLLEAWELNPDAMMPATLALPLTENTWHVYVNDIAVVRTDEFQGFACDRANLVSMLELAIAAADIKPQLIHIHNDSSHEFKTAFPDTIPIKEDIITPEQSLSELAANIKLENTLNLLQGEFAVKKSRLPQINKVWQIAAYLAAAWLFLLFFSPIISSFILSHRVNAINEQIAQIYKRNFPDSSSMVAPKMRLQDKLQKLSAEIGENRALLLMGYVGKALQAGKTVRLQRLDFQNNSVTLVLTAASSEDFTAFTDFLTQQGLTVKQQNANLNGAHINATVEVS